ncbi:MAG: RnfABCDGE type electron transport complex subunit D [Oscillospiraceae bacterium]
MAKEKKSINNEPQMSPQKRNEIRNTRRYMMDMLFMMAPLIIMSGYYYGERAFRLIVLSAITAVVAEYLGAKAFKAEQSVSDLSAVVTGIMIALCLPASSAWWLPCLGSVFAILVAKLPFGDARSQMFSPVASAIAFLTICMPKMVFTYPKIIEGTTNLGFIQGDSIAYMLSQKNSIGINIISYIDVLIGNVSGPMGATCGFAMIGAMIYLLLRRAKAFIAPASFIITSAIFAFIFPRVLTGRLTSVYMEIFGGLLLFGALFLISNEVLAPKKIISKIAYGVSGGLICMIMRRVGVFEDSTVFAIIILNAVAPAFDKIPYLTKGEKKQLAKQQSEENALEEKKQQEEKLAVWLGDEQIPDEVKDDEEVSPEEVLEEANEEQAPSYQSFNEINSVDLPDGEEKSGGEENV